MPSWKRSDILSYYKLATSKVGMCSLTTGYIKVTKGYPMKKTIAPSPAPATIPLTNFSTY